MPLPHLWADWYALESKVKMEILIFLAIILLPLTPHLFLAIFWVQHRVPKGKRGMALKNKIETAGEVLALSITLYGSAASGTVSRVNKPHFNSNNAASLKYDPGSFP